MTSDIGQHDDQGAPQAQPAWARPAALVTWRETPPLEYHQLFRGAPRYRWWKPVLALILGTLYFVTFQVALLLPVMGIYSFTNAGISMEELNELVIPDTQNPWSILVSLLSIILMIPAVWLALLSTGLTPVGRAWSVALRVRWGWIWRTVLPAIVALFVMNAVGIAIAIGIDSASGVASETAAESAPQLDMTKALVSLALILLLVPFQATAEELVYRGIFMQSLGGWLGGIKSQHAVGAFVRGPWIPILVPALLFGFSHIYDIWGFLAVTAMAVAAGWLSWRTGGLEAAITLHVVNNLVAFGFLAFAAGGETGQTAESGGPGMLIGQVIGLVLYAWWVDRDFRRRDGRRTRIDLVQHRSRVNQQQPLSVAAEPESATATGLEERQ